MFDINRSDVTRFAQHLSKGGMPFSEAMKFAWDTAKSLADHKKEMMRRALVLSEGAEEVSPEDLRSIFPDMGKALVIDPAKEAKQRDIQTMELNDFIAFDILDAPQYIQKTDQRDFDQFLLRVKMTSDEINRESNKNAFHRVTRDRDGKVLSDSMDNWLDIARHPDLIGLTAKEKERELHWIPVFHAKEWGGRKNAEIATSIIARLLDQEEKEWADIVTPHVAGGSRDLYIEYGITDDRKERTWGATHPDVWVELDAPKFSLIADNKKKCVLNKTHFWLKSRVSGRVFEEMMNLLEENELARLLRLGQAAKLRHQARPNMATAMALTRIRQEYDQALQMLGEKMELLLPKEERHILNPRKPKAIINRLRFGRKIDKDVTINGQPVQIPDDWADSRNGKFIHIDGCQLSYEQWAKAMNALNALLGDPKRYNTIWLPREEEAASE